MQQLKVTARKIAVRLTTVIIGLLYFSCISPTASAQSPLPDEMHPAFVSHRNYAERLTLTPPSSDDVVRLDLSFESQSERVVRFVWRAQAEGATSYRMQTEQAVSFEPTAVARHAGSTTDFYVIGWWAESERVIVEKWSVGSLAIGQVAAGGGVSKTTLTEPRIARSLVWMSDSQTLNPVWDAAVNPYSNTMFLIESGSPTRIHGLDLDSGTISVAYAADGSGMQDLEGVRTFAAGKHPVSGFVLMASKRRPWVSGHGMAGSSRMFVAVDASCDGVFESIFFDDIGEYDTLFPPPWDLTYTAP